MSDGAETEQLLWIVEIRTASDLLTLGPGRIDQNLPWCWLAGEQ